MTRLLFRSVAPLLCILFCQSGTSLALDAFAESSTKFPGYREDRPDPITVTLPIPPLDFPAPTAEILVQAGVQCGNGPLRQEVITFDETRKAKYSVGSVDSSGMVSILPGSDVQKVPEAPRTGWDGIEVNASGAWFTKAQSVPVGVPSGTRIEVDMSAVAFVNPFDPRCEEWYGFGNANVKDPISVPILDDRGFAQIETFVPEGVRLAAGGTGVATQQYFAGTDLPGYETLYQLDIAAREAAGAPMLEVNFVSHAALGIDSQAVIDAVTNAFVLNSATSAFELMAEVPLYSGDLPLPTSAAYNLFFNLAATAETSQGTVTDPPNRGPAAILSPVAVLSSDLGEFVSCTACGTPSDTPFENMINQSGIEPFDSGVTLFDDYLQSADPADGNFANNWQSELRANANDGGYVDFDLGQVWSMDRLAIWNGKLDEIGIQIAESPNGPWQTVGEFQLDPKPGFNASFLPEVLLLDRAYNTRYLRIDVRSVQSQGGPFGSDIYYAVVGELAVGVRPIPEPSSVLLLSGLVALSLGKRLHIGF